MIEHTVAVDRVSALAAALISTALLLAAWIMYLTHYADLGLMLLGSSLIFAALAAVLVIRCWAANICQLVRSSARRSRGSAGSGGVSPLR